jgi:hypothetical protein
MNSFLSIALEVTHGARSVDETDRDRAKRAAAEVCNRAGVVAADAAAEYRRQWEDYDDEAPMTGLALVWIEARQAADVALTESWANPEGASCFIDA